MLILVTGRGWTQITKFCCFTVRWISWVFVHVGVCVYTHARTQIMHASPLSVNFHYMWACWLLRYRFTIFSHLILMSFLFPLCFNYSLLRNNADHHSTDSYTHLASETNYLRSQIFKIIHNNPCWFLGWVCRRVPWWQMNMEHWWNGSIQEKMFCVKMALPRGHFPTTNPTWFTLELK